jgi:putative glutamine amidotransferase
MSASPAESETHVAMLENSAENLDKPVATLEKPVVLLPACHRWLVSRPYHIVGRNYIDAVRLSGCRPLIVPDAEPEELAALLNLADGLLLTGSPTNVHPRHFGEAVHDTNLPLDEERDSWTLPFIRQALAQGVPIFGICRGFQEFNVALGGSLHQAVQEVPGLNDHRGNDQSSAEVQYAQAHEVSIQPGGLLDKLVGGEARIRVNSVHGQGVNRLASGLRVEALSPDGLTEAFSMPSAPGFVLCTQWHPEWQAANNPVSVNLFKAFGAACAARRQQRFSTLRTS